MSFFDKIFGSMVSPKTAINLLHNRIEAALKTKIPGFVMHFNALNDEIFFDIVIDGQKRKYPFDEGKKFIDLGKKFLSEKIGSKDTIDYVMLDYHVEGESIATIFYTKEDGTKEQIKQTL